MSFIPKVNLILKNTPPSGIASALYAGPAGPAGPAGKTYEPHISAVGMCSTVAYFTAIAYMYSTAIYKGKMTLSLRDKHSMMLSDAIAHSEHIISFILLILYAALFIGLMADKGFLISNNQDPLQITIVTINFVVILGILLLVLIPAKQSATQDKIHFFVAFLMIVFAVSGSFIVSEIYRSQFEENDYTKTLLGLGSIGVICFLLISIICIFFYISGIKKRITTEIISSIIAVLELIIVFCYGISIGVFSAMPNVLNYEKICVGVI